MKYKRIAVVSYHVCPLSDSEGDEIGGLNVYVLELCKQLVAKGLEIDIFTRSQDKNNQEIVNVAKNLRVIHIIAGKEEKIEKKKLIPYIPEFVDNVFKFINRNQLTYDLVYSHYYLSGIIGLKIKEKYKIPLFVTFHTLALMKNLVARSESEREDVERIESELLLTKKADRIIATSASDAEYLATLYSCPKDKISILTPGINLNLFKPKDKSKAKQTVGINKDQKLILFVGRIEPLKGIDVLLYSIKVLSENNPQMKLSLWILGGVVDGDSENWSKELKRLNQLKKLLNISADVEFVGRKHQNELPDYYNASDVVILPSHYESFGITALEAMACGTPVIATDTVGIAGLFDKKHSDLITSANNPLLLADKIKHLLINENEYRRVSKELLEKVSDMSWENIAEKFTQIIDR
ncbi:MAG: glycosyltransferase [bacterium]|nr:glycosyltransferase [bacterium]